MYAVYIYCMRSISFTYHVDCLNSHARCTKGFFFLCGEFCNNSDLIWLQWPSAYGLYLCTDPAYILSQAVYICISLHCVCICTVCTVVRCISDQIPHSIALHHCKVILEICMRREVYHLMRERNSSLVRGSSRNTPSMELVMVLF